MKNDEPFQPCAGWRGFSHGHLAEQTWRSGAAGVLGMGGACRRAENWDKGPAPFSVEKTLESPTTYGEATQKIFSENWAKTWAKTVLLFFSILIIKAEGKICPPSKFGQ